MEQKGKKGLITEQFENDSAKKLVEVIGPYIDEASSKSSFNKESYMNAIKIFYGEGKSNFIETGDIINNKMVNYGIKNLAMDIGYVIDNFTENSEYYDLNFISNMIITCILFITDIEIQCLALYELTRFILEINGKKPVKCPKKAEKDFYLSLVNISENPNINPEATATLKDLMLQAMMHNEMSDDVRNEMMRFFYIRNILNSKINEEIKKKIINSFAVIGKNYRAEFGSTKIVDFAQELLVGSITGILDSEELMKHWDCLIGELLEWIKEGKVNKETKIKISETTNKLLTLKKLPNYIKDGNLKKLNELSKK